MLKERQGAAFFKRPFWRRVWIIQEIVSGSGVSILCGSRVASWSSLEILLRSLQSNPSFDLADAGYVKHLVSTRKSRSEDHAIGLLQALSSSNMTEATILRDKVFALLGLTFDGPQFVRSPSYEEMSEEAFCVQLTKSVIWAKKSLDIIFAAAPSMKLSGNLASWIPD